MDTFECTVCAGRSARDARRAARLRLPIHGERDIDRALRFAVDDEGFGHFLGAKYTDMAVEIDEHVPVVCDTSVYDIDCFFAEAKDGKWAWCCDEFTYPYDYVDDETGESGHVDGKLGEWIETYEAARNRFLRERVAVSVGRRVYPGEIEHACSLGGDVRAKRKGISAGLRFTILTRDRFRCRYCGATSSTTELHIDHVVPVSAGGPTTPENLVTACQRCNLGKSDRVDVIDAVMLSATPSHLQRWQQSTSLRDRRTR